MSTRKRYSGGAATAIALIADISAFIIGLWILLYLIDANPSNDLVVAVSDASRWLASWSYDLFTFEAQWLRVVCGYGLAAVVYLLIGNALAYRVRRF